VAASAVFPTDSGYNAAVSSEDANPHLILPVGTQVVVLADVRGTDGKPVHPRGAVGVIIQSPGDPWHSYRVRFPDDFEAAFVRRELAILSQYQEAAGPLQAYDLYSRVIYRCVIGSRAYGLDHDASDTDRRGIYLPPASLHWSLYGVPEQLENDATQEVYWEIQKFLVLALKANPNVLECLYSPLVEHASPLALELLDNRKRFLSRMVYQTYNGYVISQFKKMQADLRNQGQIKWKHVMHLIRLLLSGVAVLREAHVPVRVEAHRDQLLAIKRGEVPLEQVEAWRVQLHRDFDDAFARTTLPDRPDYQWANAFLLRARESATDRHR
jgi:predicted nucleotidyltransferase